MNKVFAIMASGLRVGTTVAVDAETALKQATKALTRSTSSKEDSEPEYQALTVRLAEPSKPNAKSEFVARLLKTCESSDHIEDHIQ